MRSTKIVILNISLQLKYNYVIIKDDPHTTHMGDLFVVYHRQSSYTVGHYCLEHDRAPLSISSAEALCLTHLHLSWANGGAITTNETCFLSRKHHLHAVSGTVLSGTASVSVS